MSTNAGKRSFVAVSAVEAKRVLQMDSNGKVLHNTATATTNVVGFNELAAGAADDVAVELVNTSGTVELTAAGAFAVGDKVYAAASGKVQAVPVAGGTYRQIGVALEAATADGDIVEIMPVPGPITVTVT